MSSSLIFVLEVTIIAQAEEKHLSKYESEHFSPTWEHYLLKQSND